jgi:hypothetical protein
MESIYHALATIGIEEEDLPQQIQNQINDLDTRTETFNELLDQLESEGLSEDEINAQTSEEDDNLAEIEEGIVEAIHAWHDSIANQRQPQSQHYNQGGGVPQNLGKQPQRDKKGGDGWFLFGAFALVVTLGAVNMFKKS